MNKAKINERFKSGDSLESKLGLYRIEVTGLFTCDDSFEHARRDYAVSLF